MENSKQFYFMAGMPRSGGTLLSSILNQNPDIYVSPQSTLPNVLGSAYNQYQSNENKDSDQFQNIYNVMDTIIPTFYKDNKQKYIIDRNFCWLDPHPYTILEHHLKNDIKVICPVRDVLAILASWNKLCEKDNNNLFDKDVLKEQRGGIPMADKRARYFMSLGDGEGTILNAIQYMQRILMPEFKDKILLVEYDDLVGNTSDTINKIYDFLEIKHFNHTYNSLSTPHEYNDIWGAKNHHKIKETITYDEYDYTKIFIPDTIKRYSNLEFWRNK